MPVMFPPESRRSLPGGWSVALPASWQCEVVEDNFQEHVFYPPDGPLTVRVTVFHLEREGVPAPPEVLEQVYRMSVPQDAQAMDVSHLAPAGFSSAGIRHWSKDEPDVIWLGCGFYGPGGWLISFNVFSQDIREAEAALELTRTLKQE